MWRILTAFLIVCISQTAHGKPFRVATWNLEQLAEKNGEGCRPRTDADYQTLKRYADQLESKVIAFQEVENKAAAERVFDPALYDIFIPQPSKPRDELCKEDPSRHIRPKLVGFAIRKGVDYKTEEPLKGLDIGRDGRWGAIITVVAGPTAVHLLALHLKFGCHSDPLDRDSPNQACRILGEQLKILKGWITEKAEAGERFILLGDFNRLLNRPADLFWSTLDSSNPPATDLENATTGRKVNCWNFDEFIDHIVFDRATDQWMIEPSFRQIRYTEAEDNKPSDHCPISIEIEVDH